MINKLNIGGVELPNNLILGPMAGVTDLPFRLLCKEQGAGLLCMEMVSAKAILYKNKNTETLLAIDEREKPVSLQLFGSDPRIISQIAHQIEDRPFDILDINMGCPVPKIVNNGEGSALMKNPVLAGHIIEETVKAINDAVDAAIEEGIAKFGGKKPNKAAIKLPLRDGDTEREDEAYAGHWFINANSKTAPQIVDKAVKPILDRDEVYSGCYARVSLNFYAFNSNGNKGIACGLGNIQKIRDGESLGGRSSATDDFSIEEDDDFLS